MRAAGPAGAATAHLDYATKSGERSIENMSPWSGKQETTWLACRGSLNRRELVVTRDALHPRVHLAFAAEQVLQRGLAQDVVHRRLHGVPEGAHRAIHRAGTDLDLAGMLVAEGFVAPDLAPQP